MNLDENNSKYNEIKEIILYLIFGVLTVVISVASFAFFNKICNIDVLIANVISWIIAVLFAFFTNKYIVFQSKSKDKKSFVTQIVSFFGSRLFTLGVEELIIFIFVTKLEYPSIIIKIIAQVIVIVLNYVLSKIIVFRKKKEQKNNI